MTHSLLHLLAQNSGGGSGAGLLAGLGILWIVLLLVILAATVFWVWMLIDCLTSTMPSGEKILWFLVIFFLHLLGALIYFFIKRSSARGTTGPGFPV